MASTPRPNRARIDLVSSSSSSFTDGTPPSTHPPSPAASVYNMSPSYFPDVANMPPMPTPSPLISGTRFDASPYASPSMNSPLLAGMTPPPKFGAFNTPTPSYRSHLSSLPSYPSELNVASPSLRKGKKAAAKFSEKDSENVGLGIGAPESEKGTEANQAVADDTPKLERFGHLDGLRGLAMIMIFTANFHKLTWQKAYPTVMADDTVEAVLDHPMGLLFFFMVTGWLTAAPFLRQIRSGQTIIWSGFATTFLRRLFQLAIPTSIYAMIQVAECAGGAFRSAGAAEVHLQSGVLGYPAWCTVEYDAIGSVVRTSGSFAAYWRTLLRIFASKEYAMEHEHDSMLWSMYWCLWGIATVFTLVLVVAAMRPRMSFVVYAGLASAFVFTNDLRVGFVVGMALADVEMSGIFKRFVRKSIWAYLLAEIVVVAIPFFFISYAPSTLNLDRWFASITYRDGAVGYDIYLTMPYSRPSVVLCATLLFTWLEMSKVMQWLVASLPFKMFGRVGLSFFLMEMTVLYGIMPRIILPYFAANSSYWESITAAYLSSLTITLILAWASHFIIDRPAARVAAWLVRSVQTHPTVSSFAVYLVRIVVKFVTTDAPLFFTDTVPGTILALPGQAKGAAAATYNWRGTPRPYQPPPPEEVGLREEDLVSTVFDADITGDAQAMRTRRILRVWSFMAPINVLGMLGLGALWMFVNPWHKAVDEGFGAFGLMWRILWLLALPYCVITFIGFATPDVMPTMAEQAKRTVYRPKIHRLYIASVSKGSNEEALRRAHATLKDLEQYHPCVRAVVITDEPYEYKDLFNVVCPKSYKSAGGKAKHKARALDYFRKSMKLTAYDWVLHMDEESQMDAESLRGCIDFIRYGKDHVGQGVILYNAHDYWKNWLFTSADTMRAGDDLARFSFQTNVVHRPIFGVHGSFLMLNGDVENVTGWDFGTLAEDFEFSQEAWKHGFTIGRIHGFVREQSATNLRDFFKQRRRWYLGIQDVPGVASAIVVKIWTSSIFCIAATVINVGMTFLVTSTANSPRWVYVLTSFNWGVFYFLLLSGAIVHELDYGYSWKRAWLVPLHLIACIVLQPISVFLEMAAIVWALDYAESEVGFEVIKKLAQLAPATPNSTPVAHVEPV